MKFLSNAHTHTTYVDGKNDIPAHGAARAGTGVCKPRVFGARASGL